MDYLIERSTLCSVSSTATTLSKFANISATTLARLLLLYCDNGGIIRGKATHASKLHTRIHEGIGQTLAMQAFTGVETLASVEGMGPVGEFRFIPDPDTLRN